MTDVLLNIRAQRRSSRQFKRRQNLEDLTDGYVKERYRLTRGQIVNLHETVRAELNPRAQRSHPLSAMTKVRLLK